MTNSHFPIDQKLNLCYNMGVKSGRDSTSLPSRFVEPKKPHTSHMQLLRVATNSRIVATDMFLFATGRQGAIIIMTLIF